VSPRAAFFEQVLERVEALPEVRSAAVVSYLPLRGSAGGDFSVQGRESTADLDAEFRAISTDYFRTMGTPLLQGREFDRRDVGDASSVAIINQTMARRFFPTENPIGKRIKRGSPWMTIVGIVGDVKHRGLTDETAAEIFVPYLQPSSTDFFPRELVVRTASDPLRLVPTVRSEVWAVDKDQPISDIRLLSEVLSDSLSQRRFNMLLLSIFGMAGLLLAAVGVYGVLSHAVTQRTHEIGIRMALGAQRSNIVRLVVNHGLKLVLVGLAAGLGSALVLTRLLSTLLYGVTPTDPFILITVSLLLFCVALVACYIPARRATKVDPMVALRWE
jgi:putative ABC transport system permease protein